jgi:rhamnosyl/mannosyltransferase
MYGVPVVASRVGGMPYIVEEGETGLLVDPADSSGLAAAISSLLRDVTSARLLGE